VIVAAHDFHCAVFKNLRRSEPIFGAEKIIFGNEAPDSQIFPVNAYTQITRKILCGSRGFPFGFVEQGIMLAGECSDIREGALYKYIHDDDQGLENQF
jgi:hypothetical protein